MDDTNALVRRARRGDRAARDRILERFTPLVKKTAWKWRGRGVDLDELEQEASLGILAAIDHYEPAHDSKASFLTYAHACVRGAVLKAIGSYSRLVRVPLNVFWKTERVGVVSISGWKATDGDEHGRDGDLADRRESQVEESDTRELLRERFRCLSFRERYVIARRFGLGGEGPAILQDVGDELRLSRERVRQIEKEALRKLRGAA